MTQQNSRAQEFRILHQAGCFVMPNPWDEIGARILASCGFKALATTSSGYAFSTGRKDGSRQVSREETLQYGAQIAAVSSLPVTADTEDCYSETPEGVAETVRLAAVAGLAGVSIEDRNPSKSQPFRDFSSALERVSAAAEAARRHDVVLTARADGFGKGAYSFDELLRRLRAFEEAGAEVLYAPGLPNLESIKTVCQSFSAPVNHVLGQGAAGLCFQDLAEAGVRRISLGGSLTRAALGQLKNLSQQLIDGDFSAIDVAPPWKSLI